MPLAALKHLPEPLRWLLFRALEAASEKRNPGVALMLQPGSAAAESPGRWLWVYCTSIGEMQALEPLVRDYQARTGLRLLLISNHPHYADSYLAKFPQAWFAGSGGQCAQVAALLKRFPPAELLIGEIPCLLSDAPCRFSYAWVHGARRAGARISIINGWLYGEAPVARLDQLEKQWFERDYLQHVDLCFVQTEAVATTLRERGLPAGRITVTGSIKFDQLQKPQGPAPHSPDWWRLLQMRDTDGRRPLTLVAGCLTEEAEQRRVLDAFVQLRSRQPDARLLIAPRHPEKPERMAALHALLREYALPYCFRTDWQGEPPDTYAVLVLNTIGELRHFYALADIAHVGSDHNVLEPLACGVPVSVSGEWHRQYPSYPIYLQCLEAGLVRGGAHAADLVGIWQDRSGSTDAALATLRELSGATSRVLSRLIAGRGSCS